MGEQDGEAIEFAIDGSDSESADLPVISFRRSPQPHNAGPSGNVDFVQRSESTSRVNHCSDPRSRRATPAHGPAVGWRSEDRTRPSRVTGPGTVDAGLSRSRRTGTGTIRRKRLRRPAPGQKSVFNVKFDIRSKTVKNFVGGGNQEPSDVDEDSDEFENTGGDVEPVED